MRKYSLIAATLLFCSPLMAGTLTVNIEGVNDEEMEQNARNAASISTHHEKEAPEELRLQWLYQRSIEEIADSFIPYGYYKARVTGSLNRSGDDWIANYRVTLNEPVKVNQLNMALTGHGKDYWGLKRALRNTKVKEGELLDQEHYEETKAELMEVSQERGYFDAHFPDHRILVDLIDNSSDIYLTFDTGDRYRFGEITFNEEYFDEALLKRMVTFHHDAYYADDEISEFQSQLSASNYFDNIVITREIDHESQTVPLNVLLERRKKRTASGGIGYSTDIGFKLMAGMNWHYLNSKGHKFVIDGMYGQRKRDGLIRYTIPGHNPVQDSINLFLKYDYEDTKDKDYTTLSIGASVDKERRLWSFGYGLEYQYDRFLDLTGKREETYVLMPSIYGEWKSHDRVRFGKSGVKISARLRGADSKLGSDISFIQAHLKAHYILPFGRNNRVIMRGELGHTYMRDGDLNRLPPSLRFYTGGDQTVRGYSYHNIGELDYRGRVAGGKRLAVVSAEYERRFKTDYAAAIFVDAGDAYNGARPDFKVGAGVGARWYSPIGAVRFDVAHGFHKRGDTVRLHLTIGTDL